MLTKRLDNIFFLWRIFVILTMRAIDSLPESNRVLFFASITQNWEKLDVGTFRNFSSVEGVLFDVENILASCEPSKERGKRGTHTSSIQVRMKHLTFRNVPKFHFHVLVKRVPLFFCSIPGQ